MDSRHVFLDVDEHVGVVVAVLLQCFDHELANPGHRVVGLSLDGFGRGDYLFNRCAGYELKQLVLTGHVVVERSPISPQLLRHITQTGGFIAAFAEHLGASDDDLVASLGIPCAAIPQSCGSTTTDSALGHTRMLDDQRLCCPKAGGLSCAYGGDGAWGHPLVAATGK